MTMEENNKNMERLLQMLDNPAAYSEQEITDIINADEQTRETYRLMCKLKSASCAEQADDIDVDEAWRQFEREHFAPQEPQDGHKWFKIAAVILAIISISGIAVAAVKSYVSQEQKQRQDKETMVQPTDTLDLAIDITPPTATVRSFDNVPLEEILNEMAAFYHVEAVFKNDDVRQLRFHYEWNPDDGLDAAVNGLNHFKRVNIERTGNQLVVRRT